MTGVGFWLYTIFVGTLFAYAVLWAIAEWLRSRDEAKEVEPEEARLGEVVRRDQRAA